MFAGRPGPNSSPTVLVVEALPSMAKVLRISLGAAGFQVAEAVAGAQALQILEQEQTDAVILDLELPDRGEAAVLDCLRQAVHSGFHAWVVISTLDREEAAERYGPLGDHFLAKPFDPWDLIRMLATLMPETNGGEHR